MKETGTLIPRSFPSLDRLRDRARREVEGMGLQRVARAVGMGHESLARFLEGGSIRNQSRHNLFEWLAAQDAPQELQTIVHDLPPDHQRAAVGEILQLLRRHHLAATGVVPVWLRADSDELASGEPRRMVPPPSRSGEHG